MDCFYERETHERECSLYGVNKIFSGVYLWELLINDWYLLEIGLCHEPIYHRKSFVESTSGYGYRIETSTNAHNNTFIKIDDLKNLYDNNINQIFLKLDMNNKTLSMGYMDCKNNNHDIIYPEDWIFNNLMHDNYHLSCHFYSYDENQIKIVNSQYLTLPNDNINNNEPQEYDNSLDEFDESMISSSLKLLNPQQVMQTENTFYHLQSHIAYGKNMRLSYYNHGHKLYNWYIKNVSFCGIQAIIYNKHDNTIIDSHVCYWLRSFNGKIFKRDFRIDNNGDYYICDNLIQCAKNKHYFNHGATNNDIIGIHLNTQFGILSFSCNNKQYGVAFYDVPCISNAKYRLIAMPSNGSENIIEIVDISKIVFEDTIEKSSEKQPIIQINQNDNRNYINECNISNDVEDKNEEQDNSNDDNSNNCQYSYEQLTDKNIRATLKIDTARKEQYLTDDEFIKIFKMNKSEFSKLASWKQTKLKKDTKLF